MHLPCLSPPKNVKLISILLQAYEDLNKSELPGSCTVCLALLTAEGQLHVLNIGDSGLHVVRNGVSVFCTSEQQHYFNCPFQLGMGSDDIPSDGEYYVLEVRNFCFVSPVIRAQNLPSDHRTAL